MGPGAWNMDLGLHKNFKLREHLDGRLSADLFNFFNHPTDDPPDGKTGLQNLSRQTNNPRIIQFSLRFDW
jgi:hypothetical protein